MKKLGFLITMLVITSLPAWSQGAKSIRITEGDDRQPYQSCR